MTSDYGATFRSIAANLPTGGPDFVHVIREDPVNPRLLFVGTDVGAYVSSDRGGSWQRFMNGLPTVPVHDLRIHPREHELVAGTHGRSIWIADILPLEQLVDSMRGRSVALYAPKTAYQYGQGPVEGQAAGHQLFEAPSPAYGADLWYRLAGGAPRDTVKLVITDVRGDTVRTLRAPGGAGLHKVTWDFRGRPGKAPALSPAGLRDSIVQERRMAVVLDSLEKAGTLPKALLAQVRAAVAAGTLQELQQQVAAGGGAGGRSRGAGAFNARPGEGPLPRAAGAAGAAEGEGSVDPGTLGDIARLLRPAGAPFTGGTGRGSAPIVAPGDYLVTLVAGSERLRQVLHVERLPGGGNATAGFGEAGDGDGDDEP